MMHPVILAGGSGTRLWPISRKSYPKQFSALLEGGTLFQRAIQRVTGPGFAAPIVVTSNDFRFIVQDQLASIGIDDAQILVEPMPRNTGPAILAAAHAVGVEDDPEAQLFVCPSDQLIGDDAAFLHSVGAASSAAEAGRLVVFGVKPDRVETGYGYLEPEASAGGWEEGARPLARYIEKPPQDVAKALVEGGKHLWSAGIFLFRVADLFAAFEGLAPEMNACVWRAVKGATSDLGFSRLDAIAFGEAQNISIDYAIMERADNLSVVQLTSSWSDLGSWDAVWRESDKDADGVAIHGHARAYGCENTLLRSESGELQVIGMGLKDVAVVAMRDAVLVTAMDKSQGVRDAVDDLREDKVKQATEFPRCHRPWGWYETVSLGDRFQVKRIMVSPGAKLSLQSHFHRAEHWVVVQGSASVTVGDEIQLLTENESVYVPLGATHRLENPGLVELHLIEVQTGSYLGEDDIVRYDDIYARDDVG